MIHARTLRTAAVTAAFFISTVIVHAAPYDDLIDGCKQGDLAKVQAAIAAGADVNSLDASGNPPLTTAVFWEEVVDALMNAGANPNLGKLTPLYNAAGNGCIETVKRLLAKGADANNAQVPGSYPLEYAVQQTNNADIVKLLIDAGAKTDIRNAAGANLIYVWADSLNPADKIKSAQGITAVLEKSYGYKMPDWYKNQNTGNDPEAVLKLLLANTVDINAPATDGIIKGWTPLLATLRADKPEKARMLVANGADVKTAITIDQPKLSYYPICLAAERGDPELVSLMIANGADLAVQADNSALLGNSGFIGCTGLTPLNIALMFGKMEAAKLLLDAGADASVGVSGTVFLPIRIFYGASEPVMHKVKNKSAVFFAIDAGNTGMINQIGEKRDWNIPEKFTIDAPRIIVYNAGKKYEATFKKQDHVPSSWAEKIGYTDLAKSLKAKKI